MASFPTVLPLSTTVSLTHFPIISYLFSSHLANISGCDTTSHFCYHFSVCFHFLLFCHFPLLLLSFPTLCYRFLFWFCYNLPFSYCLLLFFLLCFCHNLPLCLLLTLLSTHSLVIEMPNKNLKILVKFFYSFKSILTTYLTPRFFLVSFMFYQLFNITVIDP